MCHLVLSLSRFRIFRVVLRPSNSCVCLLHTLPFSSVFSSITLFRRQFVHKLEPIHLASIFLNVYRIFLPFLTPCNIYSVCKQSVQIIFSILLQKYSSKYSGYFSSTLRGFQVTVPRKVMLQMQHFTNFILKFQSKVLVKSFVFVKCCFLSWQFRIVFYMYMLHNFVFMSQKYLKYFTSFCCFWHISICTADGCLKILITLDLSTIFSIPQNLRDSENLK
jgi:hypothetical protein